MSVPWTSSSTPTSSVPPQAQPQVQAVPPRVLNKHLFIIPNAKLVALVLPAVKFPIQQRIHGAIWSPCTLRHYQSRAAAVQVDTVDTVASSLRKPVLFSSAKAAAAAFTAIRVREAAICARHHVAAQSKMFFAVVVASSVVIDITGSCSH